MVPFLFAGFLFGSEHPLHLSSFSVARFFPCLALLLFCFCFFSFPYHHFAKCLSLIFMIWLHIVSFLTGVKKPKSVVVTTSTPLSPEVLTASTVTAPASFVHHHHYGDVTSQDRDSLKRKRRKAKKQNKDVFFCNFPDHQGLVSRVYCSFRLSTVVIPKLKEFLAGRL